jgi:NADPH:quinone reductase-like Zn-dependent oxidoreductase
VTRFRPGDEVFGQSLVANLWRNGGAFAEHAAVREARVERKPANLTFEQAAAVPTSGSIAVQGVRDEGRLRPGQRVLINGAGGGVGTISVQLAKAYKADVTAVDSTGKLDMLRSIGVDPDDRWANPGLSGAATATVLLGAVLWSLRKRSSAAKAVLA